MLSALLGLAGADWGQCWTCSQRDKQPVADFGTLGVGTAPIMRIEETRVEFAAPTRSESLFSKGGVSSGRTTPSTRVPSSRVFRDGSRLTSACPTPAMATPRGVVLGGYHDRLDWQACDDDFHSQVDPLDDSYMSRMNECREDLGHALRKEKRAVTRSLEHPESDRRFGASGRDAFKKEIARCVTKSLQGFDTGSERVSRTFRQTASRRDGLSQSRFSDSGSGSDDSEASEGEQIDRQYQRQRVPERIGAIRRRQRAVHVSQDHGKKAQAIEGYQDLMRSKFERIGVDSACDEDFDSTSNPVHAVVDAVARYHSHCAVLGEYYAVPGARFGLSTHQHEELDSHARKLREPDPTRFMPSCREGTTRI